MKMLITCTAM